MSGTFTAVFDNARAVVKAENACSAAGIPVAVVPPPAARPQECGMALRVAAEDRAAFDELMTKNNLHATLYG